MQQFLSVCTRSNMKFTGHMMFYTSTFPAASLIFSTLASDRPLMLHRALRVVIWIPFTVQMPTTFIFLISATFCGQTGRRGVVRWPCGRTDFESNKMWLGFFTKQKTFFCGSKDRFVEIRVVSLDIMYDVYSQFHVSGEGQCLGRRTPIETEKYSLICKTTTKVNRHSSAYTFVSRSKWNSWKKIQPHRPGSQTRRPQPGPLPLSSSTFFKCISPTR